MAKRQRVPATADTTSIAIKQAPRKLRLGSNDGSDSYGSFFRRVVPANNRRCFSRPKPVYMDSPQVGDQESAAVIESFDGVKRMLAPVPRERVLHRSSPYPSGWKSAAAALGLEGKYKCK